MLRDGRVLISYDVVSLFTNVPLEEAIFLATDLIIRYYGDSIGFSRESIRGMLTLCSQGIIFTAKGKAFVQKDGVAMGSPLGPLLANIYMCHLEEKLKSCPIKIHYYKRYMDDTLVIVDSNSEALRLLEFWNSLCTRIKFTMESMSNNCLPFLDLLIKFNQGLEISTTVYRKSTNTDAYLAFNSCPESY